MAHASCRLTGVDAEALRERDVLRTIVERGYFVDPPAWEVQRLLWIGRADGTSALYGLPRDVVALLVRWSGTRCTVQTTLK